MEAQSPAQTGRSLLAVALALVLSVTACTATPSGQPTPTLTIGQSNKLSSRTLLEAAGLADTPYTIKWAEFNATPDMLEAISSGAVDVGGNGGTTGAIQAFYGNRKVKVAAAAITSQIGEEGSAVIVPSDSPVRTFTDLKGKRIGVTFGSGVHYYTYLALEQFGLSPSDVEFVNLKTSDAYAAFVAGQIDAWAIWDPNLSTAQTEVGARSVLTAREIDELGSLYTYQFVNEAVLTDPAKTEAIADFLRRLVKAQEWVNNHPAAWADAGEKLSGLTPAASQASAERQSKSYAPIMPADLQALQKEAEFWVGLGTYPRPVDVTPIFTFRFNADITKALEEGTSGGN